MKMNKIKKIIQKKSIEKRKKNANKNKNARIARIYRQCMICLKRDYADRLEKYSLEKSGCYWKLPVGYQGSHWTHFKRLPASLMRNVMRGELIEKTIPSKGRENDIKYKWKVHNMLNEKNFAEEVCLTNPTNPFFGGRVDGMVFTKRKKVLVEFKGVTREQFIVGNKFADQTPAIMQIALYSYITGWKDVILVYGVQKNFDIVVKTKYFTSRMIRALEKDILKLRHGLWINAFVLDILIWKILGFKNIAHTRLSKKLKNKLRDASEWLIPKVLAIQVASDLPGNYKNIVFPKLKGTTIYYDDFEL